MEQIRTYLEASLQELHQVRWPTRQQAVRLSGIVLGFTAVTAVVFGALDYLLVQALHFLLTLA
ncbi:preprotein translocase subunit SecE [Candidatus Peribacteria bacterium]|nr:preprotein translocase subunit SecE [Candidatus Peribacteria bacterium]